MSRELLEYFQHFVGDVTELFNQYSDNDSFKRRAGGYSVQDHI